MNELTTRASQIYRSADILVRSGVDFGRKADKNVRAPNHFFIGPWKNL
jgi:hypothetical protein